MNHPTSEHWMSYLYDELSPSARREADRHLRTCAECRSRLGRWRATMGLLDTDEATLALPARNGRTVFAPQVVRWAVAASVVLLSGFFVGRATNLNRTDVEQQISLAREQITHDLRQRHEEDLKALTSATFTAATEQYRTVLAEVTRQYNETRAQERRDWITAIEDLNQQHAQDLADVKSGLNSLARRTGDGFQQAELQLNLLASYLPVDGSNSETSDSPIPPSKQ